LRFSCTSRPRAERTLEAIRAAVERLATGGVATANAQVRKGPPRLEVTVRVWGARAKVAVTLRAVLIVTEQVPVPVHAPLQPAKDEPAAGVAVNVTAAL
jgi:hypothetical protein